MKIWPFYMVIEFTMLTGCLVSDGVVSWVLLFGGLVFYWLMTSARKNDIEV